MRALAAGEFREIFEYNKLFSLFTAEMQAPSLDGFHFLHTGYKVIPVVPGVHPSDVHIVIKAHGGDIPLSVDSNGTLRFPVTDALKRENPKIVVNQPKGLFGLSPLPEVSAPPTLSFNYSLYDQMANEYTAWLRKLDDQERAQMPSARALVIRFPEGVHGTSTVALPEGPKHLDMDTKREIRIEEGSAWKKADAAISLSAMPEAIELSLE